MKKPLVDTLLQPLRVPPGWLIEFNIFTEFDPLQENMEYFYGSCLMAASNEQRGLSFELFFTPEGDPEGSYEIDFFKSVSQRKDILLERIVTKSRSQVVHLVELFMSEGRCQ